MSVFTDLFGKKQETVEKRSYNPFAVGGLLYGNYEFSENPLSLSAVYAATELISNSVAELPLYVKVKGKRKDKHFIYDLFYKNSISKFILMKQLVVDMLLYGNSYCYIRKDASGRPIELVYLPKSTVSIIYNQPNDKVIYQVTGVKNVPNKLTESEVLHFFKNSRDGVKGIGIIAYANKAFKLSEYQNNSATDYFGSGCGITGILKFNEQVLDVDKEEIRKNWQQVHGGQGSGLAIMDYNCDFLPVSQNPKDSQMIESRLFSIQDIARYFGISPVLLQDLSHSSYSTLEAAQLEFVTHTLMPYVTLFQDEMTRKLCNNEQIDLDESYLLVADKQSQANYINTLVHTGVITPNEGREMLGLAPISGADSLIIPFTDIDQNTINKDSEIKDETISDK